MIKTHNRSNLHLIIFSILTIIILHLNTYSYELKVGASFAPPYYNVDEDRVTGIIADIMKEVVENADYDLIWKPAPTRRVYNNLFQGKIDVYLGPIMPNFKAFKELAIHSETSPITLELGCYYFGEKPIISKKEQLTDKKVLIIRGYTYGGLINYILQAKNKVEYTEVESFEQAIKTLKNRKMDYHLNYKKAGNIYLQNYSEPDLKYSKLLTVDLYIIVSKSNPKAKEIMSKLESSFLEVSKNK